MASPLPPAFSVPSPTMLRRLTKCDAMVGEAQKVAAEAERQSRSSTFVGEEQERAVRKLVLQEQEAVRVCACVRVRTRARAGA